MNNKVKSILCVVVIILIFAVGLWALIQCIIEEENNKIRYMSHLSDKEVGMIVNLAKHGVKHPIELGIALCKTKRPTTLAAIAIQESGGDIDAVGDSGDSKGAFQVQEKYWGPVPKTATEQALQAEDILEELLAANRGRLRQSLAKYNGGNNPPRSSFGYADKVLRIKRNM